MTVNMTPEQAELKAEMQEAIRLYLWYQGSKFSWHKAKANAAKAKHYAELASDIHFEYLSQRYGDK